MGYVYDYKYMEKENPNRLVVIMIKIDPDLLALLDRYAINHRINRSEAIRKAIIQMIQDQTRDVKARVESGW